MLKSVARLVSILGHPGILMPFAAWLSTMDHDGADARLALPVAAFVAAAVTGYSLAKVKRGDWAHIDASGKSERHELTRLFGPGLLVAATLLFLTRLAPGVSLVMGLSGAIVMAAHGLRHRSKPSLHVAFAAFAALLAWPGAFAVVLAAFAVLVAWSRRVLERHTRLDVVHGAILGLAAGVAFQSVASHL